MGIEVIDGFERIKFDELQKSYPGICRYLTKMTRGQNPDNLITIVSNTKAKDNRYLIKFYTHEYEYLINFNPDKNYLGAGFLCRKSLPGENHRRGNDLPDGPADKSTMKKIIYSIINNELVKLS